MPSPPCILAARSAAGVALFSIAGDTNTNPVVSSMGVLPNTADALSMAFSASNVRVNDHDGQTRAIAVSSADSVRIFKLHSSAGRPQEIVTLPVPLCRYVAFSPLGRFAATWTRPLASNVLAEANRAHPPSALESMGVDLTHNAVVWELSGESGESVPKSGNAAKVVASGEVEQGEKGEGEAIRKEGGSSAESPESSASVLLHFSQRSPGIGVQWTSDERVCARLVGAEVQFFDCGVVGGFSTTPCAKLRCADGSPIAAFAVAPGQPSTGFNVAIVVAERKGAPASVRVYRYPDRLDSPVAQKAFFKAQDIKLRWSRPFASVSAAAASANGGGGGGGAGSADSSGGRKKNKSRPPASAQPDASGSRHGRFDCALLIETHTDYDATGKSYYGETGLYFLSTERNGAFDCNVPLEREGPIHSASWSASGLHFAVTYGFMPEPQTSIFNNRCEKVADCGTAGRNTNVFNTMVEHPLVAVAGFGNLPGDVDIWDPKRLKKVGVFRAPTASELIWAPDGRRAVTSVLSPRMHVGNGFTIWNYDGTKLHTEDIAELLEVQWQPADPCEEAYPDCPPSPRTYARAKRAEQEPENKPAKYVPPHLRNKQPTGIVGSSGPAPTSVGNGRGSLGAPPGLSRMGGAPPGLSRPVTDGPRKYQPGGRNAEVLNPSGIVGSDGPQRNRGRRRKGEDDAGNAQQQNGAISPRDTGDDDPAVVARKLRAAQKKMRQVLSLKDKLAEGGVLDSAQQAKVAAEAELAAEIAVLEDASKEW